MIKQAEARATESRPGGTFVVFEGGEGCGKSTQSLRLVATLKEAGFDVVHTRDPGGCESAEAIRNLLVTGDPDRWTRKTDMLLYTAARVELVERVIWPALERGAIVVCDRFVDSTLAYQANGDRAKEKVVREMHSAFCRGLVPDLTFILDADPRTGLARSRRRLGAEGSDEGRFEAMEIAFHDRLRAVFLRLAEEEAGRYCVIDATLPLDVIAERIRDRALALPSLSRCGRAA
jgi:dTMP kinase